MRGVLAENSQSREAQQILRRIEERALRAAAAGPRLSAELKVPITLELRDATLRQVFEALSKSTGLNFIFDRDIRQDLRTTIFVRNSSIEDVLRFVLVTNQLERKVLSDNTVLVYPNTPAKQRDYQDLVTKTFYLANADVKSTASMIRTLVKTKDMHIDEKLNMLVIRDTPEAVRMAERLVANQDLAEPEVMLEVVVLEAALALNFRNQIDRSNLLANPRIRVKNREKAKVHIGDKVPVITTTSTSTGFASQSVTYLDVGLKLEVEPNIYLEDEVGIKVGLEVSNIAREIQGTGGTLTYQVGTRNASTVLRLKDGETQVLAGLINDEDRRTINQIPGLGDLPLLGRLFGSRLDTRNKTEIVLLITPRVIRNLARPELRFEEFPSGTEAAIGAAPLLLQSTTVQTPESTSTTFAPTAKPAGLKVTLEAPSSIPAGEEFTLQVSVDSEGALRSGLLDFAFDPSRLKFVRAELGALIAAADKEASFRSNAPEAIGRLNLSFAAKGDIKGQGELARIVFQVVGNAAGAPMIRLEALSFTSDAGKVVSAQLPPPVSLSLTR